MRVVLTGMWGLYNRGCEAIARGTTDVLRRVWPEVEVGVAVGYPRNAETGRRRLGDVGFAVCPMFPRRPLRGFRRLGRELHRALYKLTGDARLGAPRVAHPVEGVDLILAVGGDTMVQYTDAESRMLRHAAYMRRGVSVGLWGMNLEPFPAPSAWLRELPRVLARYRLITVRDEASRQYLASLGVEANVRRMADPAFEMPAEAWEVTECLPEPGERGVVGLNLSPYLLGGPRSRGRVGTAVETIEALVAAGFGVLLVPHCFPPGCPADDDDLLILRPAFEAVRHLGRRVTLLPEGLSAPQLKHAIAQCDLYAGARMHSTIAAWSSGVPVLTLSYSRKSLSFNDEIHGHREWVLPVEQFAPPRVSELMERMSVQADDLRAEVSAGVARMRAHTTALVAELKAVGLPE